MRDDVSARVRRFEPDDAETVRRLHRRALREAGTDPDDIAGIEDMEDIQGAFVDQGGEFLVAEADEAIVAVGGLAVAGEEIESHEGELRRIAVHPDHHREGHGSRIVAGLEDAARERGLDRVFLWTARRQRAATEFYPARGYEEAGRRTVGEYELLRFEKPLDGSD